MSTKQLLPNQCDLLHLVYGKQDCCLCTAKEKPHLGHATTAQLIDELRARCEVNGTLGYKTVQEL